MVVTCSFGETNWGLKIERLIFNRLKASHALYDNAPTDNCQMAVENSGIVTHAKYGLGNINSIPFPCLIGTEKN